MRSYLPLLIICLLVANCNRRTAGPADPGSADIPPKRMRVGQVLRAVEQNKVTEEWVDARARINLDSDKLTIGGNATIRLHRDEAIWISVKKFGFEGARALIRPDSFFLHNRLEGEYIAEPLSYVEEKYNVPARFDLLQEIFFGNAVFLTDDQKLDYQDGNFRLTGRDRRFATDHRIDPVGFRLRSMQITDLGEDRQVLVTNDDYETFPGSNQPFSTRRRIVVNDPKEGEATVEMEFGEVRFGEEAAMPF